MNVFSFNYLQIFHGNLSAALHRKEDYTEALDAAEKSIELNSEWTKVRFLLIKCILINCIEFK